MATSGAIWTASNVANQLYEQNRDYNNRRTWHTALANNSAQGSTAIGKLEEQYNSATNEAYISYLKNKNSLQSSGVVGEGQSELMSSNELALQEAYDSYRNSMNEAVTAVDESIAQNAEFIQQALSKQAEYTADYANAHWDYLNKLYEDYINGENTLFNETLWNRYLVDSPVLDANGNATYNSKGNPITEKRVMTRDELQSVLYDSNGNLTLKGADFYDQIENAVAQGGTGMSWGDYLMETNEDLYNWATSYNQYDYTFEGTNAGSFRTMVGMMSDDNQWSFAERYGGFSEEELTSMYEPFLEHMEELNSIDVSSNPDKLINGIKNINNDLWDMAEELGLDGQMEDQGITREMTEQWLTDARKGVYSEGELSGEMLETLGTGVAAGAAAGTLVSGGNPIAALITGFAGLVGGAIDMKNQEKEIKKQNKEIANKVKTEYTNMLNSIINEQLRLKRQAEIDILNTKY